jgi:outer membrane biosynthesis protein TonB
MATAIRTARNSKESSTTVRGADGFFVLENKNGDLVRYFNFDAAKLVLVYRHDNRRIEVVASVKELEEMEIDFDILAESTPAKIKKDGLAVAGVGRIRFIHQIGTVSPSYDLAPEQEFDTKKFVGWGAAVQLGLAGIILIAGALSGTKQKDPEVQVTLLDKAVVEKMLEEAKVPTPPEKQPEPPKVEKRERVQAPPVQAKKNIVVAPSETRITKDTPVPTRSTSFKKGAKVAKSKHPRGGGYKGEGPRGYGTNEPNMNSIGALGALNGPRVKGGNGGRGGLNLQAVGNEAGSGAGGKGFGGFGSNGGGGRGKGGLGTGKGMGLSNAMYGKGLIAAPFGDGGAAPGSGGYGTRGRAGGGAQGAGYGTTTIVGSWKGTGPKGNGPAGSGVGNGDPNGSPWGSVDGDDGDAVVTGGLDKDQIGEVIQRNLGQITYCYEQGLQRQAGLSGRVTMKWQIGGNGRVSSARVGHSSLRSAQVENCIAGKLKTWSFPRPKGGVTVAVTYPFMLRRVAK